VAAGRVRSSAGIGSAYPSGYPAQPSTP
jgi:hypothetical protein